MTEQSFEICLVGCLDFSVDYQLIKKDYHVIVYKINGDAYFYENISFRFKRKVIEKNHL